MSLVFYDLSNHQAGLKLASDSRVKDSQAYIFKATEGTYFVDKECDKFVQQAKKLGKSYGVYHFLDGSDAIKQAEYFYSNIKGYVGEAVLVLDYEMYGRQGAVKAKQFLDHLYKLTGVRGWIYMNESDSNNDNWGPLAKDYALWIAKYSIQKPNHTKGLNIIAWQYTSTPLDKNIYYGDLVSWKAYAKGDKKGTQPDIKPQPAKSDYWFEGTRFKAKVDLIGHYPDKWSKLTGSYVEKGKEFDIVKLVKTSEGTSHAVLHDGSAVTLLKEYVEKIK